MKRVQRGAVLVGVVAAVLVGAFAVGVLRDFGWDSTIFISVGEESIDVRNYAEERLGRVVLRPQQGHDGKFFFVQANDPWVLNPQDHATVLDRPLYRSQRMLYPLLAGLGGLAGPQVIVWSMLAVNILAIGVGSWLTGLIAIEMEGSPWWGLSFALNLGFISEVNIGGAGVVAAAAAFGAVLMFMRSRTVPGITLLVLAVLAREAMLVVAAGIALYLWMTGRRDTSVASAAVPGLSVVAWAVYLRLRIDEGANALSEVQEIGLPFVGFARAFESWGASPLDLAVGLVTMAIMVLFARRVIAGRDLVGWAFVGYAALATLFTEQVWHSYFDITRAVAPALTAYVLLLFLGQGDKQRLVAEDHSLLA